MKNIGRISGVSIFKKTAQCSPWKRLGKEDGKVFYERRVRCDGFSVCQLASASKHCNGETECELEREYYAEDCWSDVRPMTEQERAIAISRRGRGLGIENTPVRTTSASGVRIFKFYEDCDACDLDD